MPRRALAVLAAALLALAALPAAAQDHTDTVDLQLAGSASVKGTIRGALERESFLLRLPAGASLTAVAKRKGKGAFVPLLDLVDASSAVVATGTAKGKGSTLRSDELGESGDYRLRVFGDGTADGDYTLKVAVKLRGKWRGTGGGVTKAFTTGYSFGAPAGATAQVRVSPARGSGYVPELEGIEGPDGFATPLSGTRAGPLLLGDAGTYTVGFHDAGSEGGAWVCDVVLRLPRVARSSIDISGSALTGEFSDDEAVFGREIGADGGLLDPPDLGGGLDGATVLVPPGGLGLPVVITMNEGDPFGLLNGDHTAGPAVELGPGGTTFEPGKEAVVTIPYDTSLFTDPENQIRVYVLHEGVVQQVTPLTFPSPGFVSFPTSGFSTYVVGRSGPRPLRGSWALASLEPRLTPDFGGRVDVAVEELTFDVRDTYVLQHQSMGVEWIRAFDDGTNPPAPTLAYPGVFETEAGAVTVVDDTTIQFLPQGENVPVVARRGRSDHVLLFPPSAQETHAQFHLALRLIDGTATPANVAGRWHAFSVGVGASDEGDDVSAGIRLFQLHARGTVSFAADGTVAVSVDQRGAEAPYPTGSWTTRRRATKEPGTFTASGADVFVTLGPPYVPGLVEPEPPIRFRCCLGGDVLVGPSPGGAPELIFLVREGGALTPAALTGTTTGYGVVAERVDAKEGTGDPPSFQFSSLTLHLKHTGNRDLTVTAPTGVNYRHDSEGEPQSAPEVGEGETSTYTLARDGDYRAAFGLTGLVTRGRDLFLFGGTLDDGVLLFAGVPAQEFQALSAGD
jgi:hypothetical protein